MMNYVILFLVLAVIAGILGFGIAATAFAGIAKLLFYLFVAAFVILLIMNMTRTRA